MVETIGDLEEILQIETWLLHIPQAKPWMEMRDMVLASRGMIILIIRWSRTWLNCVLGACERQNFRVVSLEIQLRTFLSKGLKAWPGFVLTHVLLSIALIKHQEQKHLGRKRFISACSSSLGRKGFLSACSSAAWSIIEGSQGRTESRDLETGTKATTVEE